MGELLTAYSCLEKQRCSVNFLLLEWPRRPHLFAFLFWLLVLLDPLPSNLRFTALATVSHCGDPTLTLTTLWGGDVRILHAAPTSCWISFQLDSSTLPSLTSNSRGVLSTNKQGSVVGGTSLSLVDVMAGAPLSSSPVTVTCHRSRWPWWRSGAVRFSFRWGAADAGQFGASAQRTRPSSALPRWPTWRSGVAISLLTCCLGG